MNRWNETEDGKVRVEEEAHLGTNEQKIWTHWLGCTRKSKSRRRGEYVVTVKLYTDEEEKEIMWPSRHWLLCMLV